MERVQLCDEKLRVLVARKKLPRLGDQREEASVGRDQKNHRHEPSSVMASVDRESRSKRSVTSTKRRAQS